MSVPYSIVIPTKDRPTLLRRAVQSALADLAANGEVLIVDDHSKTPAEDVLRGLADDRLRFVRLPHGRTGVSAARNAGIDQAKTSGRPNTLRHTQNRDVEDDTDFCGRKREYCGRLA